MYCLRVDVTSPRQIPMHILMSLANKLPCILVSALAKALTLTCVFVCLFVFLYVADVRSLKLFKISVKLYKFIPMLVELLNHIKVPGEFKNIETGMLGCCYFLMTHVNPSCIILLRFFSLNCKGCHAMLLSVLVAGFIGVVFNYFICFSFHLPQPNPTPSVLFYFFFLSFFSFLFFFLLFFCRRHHCYHRWWRFFFSFVVVITATFIVTNSLS